MTTIYRVFLYSSDVGRLTHESDHSTREEAMAVVTDWCRDDPEEELMNGMWEIQERLNGHLKGEYSAYAHAYPIIERPGIVEGESIEAYNERSVKYQHELQAKSKQVIGHEPFPTKEAAELAIDKAVDNLAMELDSRLYGRIQREQRAAGIHEPFITDLKPFGYKVYRGERGPQFQYSDEVTVEDLKNMVFPEAGSKVSKLKGFNVSSGSLRVTDPCYSMDTWCAGTTENVMNGRWLAQVGEYREPMEEWSLERLKKQIAELEEEKSSNPRLNELMAQMEKIPEGPDREKALSAVDRLKGFYVENAMRDFARSWGNPDDWTGRIAFLHIRHESVLGDPIDPLAFVKNETLHVGVDSGQAGFFDLDKYEAALADKSENSRDNNTRFEQFYDACGENTLGAESWGIVEGFGAVSSSGYGDGGYTLCERRNEAGELIEARIVYMLEGSELFPGIGDDEEDEDAEGEEE